MAKKRPLTSPEARPRLLATVVLKDEAAKEAVMKILRESRQKDAPRSEIVYRLILEVLQPAAVSLMATEKAKAEGITFKTIDAKKAAARLIRMGYRVDGAGSRLRCPNRTFKGGKVRCG